MTNKNNDFEISIVIGEDMPKKMARAVNHILFYVRNDDKLYLYADIYLPYFINYIEFQDIIKEDPRYILYDNYDWQNKICRYRCMIKPFDPMKGIYRMLDGQLIKIGSIQPLYQLEESSNQYVKK